MIPLWVFHIRFAALHLSPAMGNPAKIALCDVYVIFHSTSEDLNRRCIVHLSNG